MEQRHTHKSTAGERKQGKVRVWSKWSCCVTRKDTRFAFWSYVGLPAGRGQKSQHHSHNSVTEATLFFMSDACVAYIKKGQVLDGIAIAAILTFFGSSHCRYCMSVAQIGEFWYVLLHYYWQLAVFMGTSIAHVLLFLWEFCSLQHVARGWKNI